MQISAGQPEWAAEDAAQHALNLANWRIKLLEVCMFVCLYVKCVISAAYVNISVPPRTGENFFFILILGSTFNKGPFLPLTC